LKPKEQYEITIKIFKSSLSLAEGLSEFLANKMGILIDTGRKINIGLSGGNTPELLFDEIVKNYRTKVDWKNVNFYWVDERCVPPNDSESNYSLAFDHLLRHLEIDQQQIYRIHGESDPRSEAERYSTEILNNISLSNGLPKFDILLMGIGSDGHTASIFPDRLNLLNSEKLCEESIHPVTGQKRITMTGRLINNSENIYFMISGADKSEAVKNILEESREAKNYPANYIKPNFGELVWFLDEEAGSKL
jgi:6-phosphogluconolactonase